MPATLAPSRARPVVKGLSELEAARRLAERGPVSRPSSSRSYGSIVLANVVTLSNAVLAVFGVLTLRFGDARDALFLGIVIANAAIGIMQEVRAKRTLDRLSAFVAPTATVIRDDDEGGVLRRLARVATRSQFHAASSSARPRRA